jgi:hypothetical protein
LLFVSGSFKLVDVVGILGDEECSVLTVVVSVVLLSVTTVVVKVCAYLESDV